VPGDPDQVIYVWWDALGNYVTSLDTPEAYQRWWAGSDRRVHLLGKGVLRFHAVYWPAMLLSAGLPLPTDILVHDYLTVDGEKISKSTGGGGADPVALVDRFGTDAVRWWLLRDVPRVGDVDFTVTRLVERANADLAGGVGNLVNRVATMVHRYRGGRVPDHPDASPLAETIRDVSKLVDVALADFDLRRACGAVWTIVDEANRHIELVRPWELARAGDATGLDAALATLVAACRSLAGELAPFLPGAAAAIARQCHGERVPAPEPLFARLSS
jgi:methionyl-tRNA synthetase